VSRSKRLGLGAARERLLEPPEGGSVPCPCPCPPVLATIPRYARRVGVALDHRRLDVYRFALQCLAAIDEIAEGMPPGRAHL
jgi:hypothetical protein